MSDDRLEITWVGPSAGTVSDYDQQKAAALDQLRSHDGSFVLLQTTGEGVQVYVSLYETGEKLIDDVNALTQTMVTIAFRVPSEIIRMFGEGEGEDV